MDGGPQLREIVGGDGGAKELGPGRGVGWGSPVGEGERWGEGTLGTFEPGFVDDHTSGTYGHKSVVGEKTAALCLASFLPRALIRIQITVAWSEKCPAREKKTGSRSLRRPPNPGVTSIPKGKTRGNPKLGSNQTLPFPQMTSNSRYNIGIQTIAFES